MNMHVIKLTILLTLLLIPLLGCPETPTPFIVKIPVGHNPSEILVSGTTLLTYVTITNDNNVVVNVSNAYPNQIIGVGNQPVGIAIWQGGARLYVVNNAGLSISVVALSNDTFGGGNSVIDSITSTSFHNMGDAIVTVDGRYLYVATDTNAVSVISTTTDKVVTTFTDPSFNYPAHLVADAFNRYIFVSESRSNAVSVISTTTNTVIKTIGVGISPNGMAETTDGNWLFVVNSGSNSISVINTNSLTVARTVTDTSFNIPQRIALTPECAYGFVSEYHSGNISVISQNALITGSGRAVIKDIYGGVKPYDVAIKYIGPKDSGYVIAALKGENVIVVIDYRYLNEVFNACFQTI
ncbi:MAG: YncE family protein [Deltaproteobacteria bacterium]|nr:YncE family protein [Deltaproteobacteria bacterium]MCL5879163.1 YncE family protein [Deltaproteobacteria bacterium]